MLDKIIVYYNQCDIHHEGVREELDVDHCVSVLCKVYILFLFVLGDLKTEAKRHYVCMNSEENSDMGCTFSELHDVTIVLNIRNI